MSERIQNVNHHQEIEYGGKKLRSQLEVNTAKVLDALGIPYSYEEKKITLLEGFYCPYQKNKVIALTYTPDFMLGNLMLECKGFETPEWKIKRKLVFKYLMDKEPDVQFYQIHDSRKELLTVLDKHWESLGYSIVVTSKPSKKKPSESTIFPSIKEAMEALNLKGKAIGPILRSLTNQTTFVYNYSWKLKKLKPDV